jgi:fructose-bisphosphate aldolase class I
MDESMSTCDRRFEEMGIPQTVEARCAYRELILTIPDLAESISGVILFDETIGQRTRHGTPFPKIIAEVGIILGIKVDAGAKEMAGHPGEKITEGLDGLRALAVSSESPAFQRIGLHRLESFKPASCMG